MMIDGIINKFGLQKATASIMLTFIMTDSTMKKLGLQKATASMILTFMMIDDVINKLGLQKVIASMILGLLTIGIIMKIPEFLNLMKVMRHILQQIESATIIEL